MSRPGRRPRPERRSRREADRVESEAAVVESEEPAVRRPKVPPPSVRQPLSADLEQEFQAALGGSSMEELMGLGGSTPAADQPLETDERYRGTVIKIHGDNVFLAFGGRNQGVVSLRQFREPPAIGAQFDVVISGYQPEDGLYELTVPGGSIDVHDWSDLVDGAVVEARITGSNVGGLECMVGGIRGFIPASQIDIFRVENFPDYYEKKLLCVVTEANERRRNLVLSHRAVVEREREQQRQQLLESLDVGHVCEGVVSNVRDFGAFVDLGGVDGLIHVSQLSWDRVGHPSEVVQPGQRVRVKVEKIDRETGKISLSYRDLIDHPWTHAAEQFPVNAIVKGTVTRVAKFGAFVKLGPGIEGLVHISELAHHRVVQVGNVVKEGDEIEVKVLAVDAENQRMSLSLKAAHPMPDAATTAEGADEPDEPPREPVVKRRHEQLKGGTSRAAGGDQFGLNW